MKCEFLGWDRPILHSAIDYLAKHFSANDQLDLDNLLLVLPSSLAGRRLGELLAEYSEKNRILLCPPEIVTVGALPEKLYQARFPFASDTAQLLTWVHVLREIPPEELQPLLLDVPSSELLQPWVELARMLLSLHRELATDLLLCSDVADRLKRTLEEPRWRVLQKIQRKYLDRLHVSKLWDVQTARRVAIERGEPATKQKIVVLGAVDMNRAQRRFLDAVAEHVTILIGAPASWSKGFDPYGTLVPDFWQDIRVQFDPSKIHVRGTASQAAEEVARQIALLGSSRTAREITLGVPDASLIPMLTESLDRVGIVARNGPGQPVDQSAPVRLLEAISEYLRFGTYQSFGSLVRCPSVSSYIRSQSDLSQDFLQIIDRYYNDTLLSSVNTTQWPATDDLPVVQGVMNKIDEWLLPLRLPKLSLTKWSEKLQRVLKTVFECIQINLEVENEAMLWSACAHVNDSICQLAEIPGDVDVEVPIDEAIEWVVRQVGKERTPPLNNPDSIEMFGWLELSLDDAPVLMLTGLHDGFVPESVNADAFLPNQLRNELGLMDNARRYARDCYVFQTVLHAREHLAIVLNHLSTEGAPQTPSRLLLAVEPNALAERVHKLIHPESSEQLSYVVGRVPGREDQTQIPIPAPRNTRVPNSLSVTDFKSFLYCPYRFYLSRIQRLETVDDTAMELAANHFGSLVHDCLTPLKDSPVAISTNPDEIRKWIFAELNREAKKRFGERPLPAVQIQIEQARQRLAAFADAQALWAGEGWEIRHAEVDISREMKITLDVDGEPMGIHGRIDRIDYNSRTKEWAILDYKTGDLANDPTRAHFGAKKGWTDLQLPLYRHLVKALDIKGPMKLGYISLPKSVGNVGFEFAEFREADLEAADEVARDVIRAIRAKKYWPPRTRSVPVWDDFGSICQTNVARPWKPTLAEDGIPVPLDFELSVRQNQLALPLSVPNQSLIPEQDTLSLHKKKSKPSTHATLESSKPSRDEALDRFPVHLSLTEVKAVGTPNPDWFNPLTIRASAGTGKTYQLAIRLLRLLFSDESPDNVLATTFTRKAAGEILERVLERLATSILDEKVRDQLAVDLQPLKITREHCQYQLARLCANLHRFRVSTLDSFYSQLARSCSLELNLPPGWQLVDPYRESQFRDQAIRRMFDSQDLAHLRALVAMLFKGETSRSVQSQIRDVVKMGYDLFRVTNKEAWNKLIPPPAPSDAEFNAAYSVLEQYSTAASISTLTEKQMVTTRQTIQKIADFTYKEEWNQLLKLEFCKKCFADSPTHSGKPLPSDLVVAIRILNRLAAHREIALRVKQSEATYELLSIYAGELDFVKRRNRAVSFNDIAFRLSEWMESKTKPKEKPAENASTTDTQANHLKQIDFRMDARIDHLLLDEFQDTSPTQWNVVKPFAEAIAREGVRQGKSFFVVGDTKQAIYGWRGGVAEIFNAVGQQLKTVKQEQLIKSWRSSKVIMDFVNHVFKNLDLHESYGDGDGAVPTWQTNFPPHETAVDKPGYVQLYNGQKGQSNYNGSNSGDSDGDEEDESTESLLEIAAEDIADLVAKTPEISIGVLLRSNADVALMINLLRNHGLDPSQEGGNPLTDSAAVELLLSLLYLADHPGDTLAAFHVTNSPLAKVLPIDAWRQAGLLGEEIRLRISQRGYGNALAQFARWLEPYCTLRDQQRLEQLVQTAYKYDASPTLRVRDFVEFVQAERVALPKPAQIRVMTTHQSKGLEFDAVFLADLNKKLSKTESKLIAKYDNIVEKPVGVIRSVPKELRPFLSDDWQEVLVENSERELTEQLCVFYVALTRARHALYLYAQPQASEATQKWGSVLQSILCDNSATRKLNEQIIFTVGQPDWWKIIDQRQNTENIKKSKSTTKRPKPIEVGLRPHIEGDFMRFRPSRKPSAAGEATLISLNRSFETSISVGAIIGTLVHRWFEEIEWLDDFEFDLTKMRDLSLRTLTPDEMASIHLEEWLQEMKRMIELDCVRKALRRDRYDSWRKSGIDRIEICNERRLLELREGFLIRGTIDRLVLGWQGNRVVQAEILDYKTDTTDGATSIEEWEAERIRHHAPQLEVYRKVLSKQYDLAHDRIGLYLILLSSDSLVSIDKHK